MLRASELRALKRLAREEKARRRAERRTAKVWERIKIMAKSPNALLDQLKFVGCDHGADAARYAYVRQVQLPDFGSKD